MKKLILASTSRYRRELLEKLSLPFDCENPLVDESILKKENLKPDELSRQLATLKAMAVLKKFPEGYVIGSDQVCALGHEILSKPGSKENALLQLKKMQGKIHELHTSVCIAYGKEKKVFTNTVKLKMFTLTDQEIEDYLVLDSPFDCAGSYKIESYGIKLFEQIVMNDHTAIIGLPLIELHSELKKLGF